MSLVTTASSKPTPKQDRVLRAIRQEIMAGRFAKDRQLPAQARLARRFDVSLVTVGLVMNRLAREGFVKAYHGSGTFVVEKLPHLTNYALIFPFDPTSRHAKFVWTKYYQTLAREALEIESRDGRRVLMYHGINEHVDTEEYQRLLSQMNSHQLAGLIFANFPFSLEGSPILEQPGLPRVALMSEHVYPQIPAVAFDFASWMDQALRYLVARGRKRVAFVLSGSGSGTYTNDLINDGVRKHRIVCPSRWRQMPNLATPDGIANCVELLMQGSRVERPNGLVIHDDNLVEPALAGLIAAGVRVPQDSEVITHCNFPGPSPSVLPVKRLGFDINQTLRRCMELIDRQRRGERVPGLSLMPAVFEHEQPRVAATALPHSQGATR